MLLKSRLIFETAWKRRSLYGPEAFRVKVIVWVVVRPQERYLGFDLPEERKFFVS